MAQSADYQRLLARKLVLMQEQKQFSDRFTQLLVSKGYENPNEDGAIENSRKLMKKLDAAIVSSKKPGYFTYHVDSALVKTIEKKGEFKLLAKKIAMIGKDLDEINDALATIEHNHHTSMMERKPPPIHSISQWFSTYGRPGPMISNVSGLASELKESQKVYGGTKHHRPFKSLAVTLKRGRLTR